jgi:hypothetical protein
VIEGGIGYGTFHNHFDNGPLDGNTSTVTSWRCSSGVASAYTACYAGREPYVKLLIDGKSPLIRQGASDPESLVQIAGAHCLHRKRGHVDLCFVVSFDASPRRVLVANGTGSDAKVRHEPTRSAR